jgi:hypothetical protein
MTSLLAIALCFAVTADPATEAGVLEGVVVNGSQYLAPVADAAVVLRVNHQGTFISVAQTTADKNGRFRFEQLPLAPDLIYLPGANFKDIHYPGSRVKADGQQQLTSQIIVVYDTADKPNPLIASSHEIEVRPGRGLLVVTETITIANRTNRSYVGSAAGPDEHPITLRLSIPPEFEKVTFEKEFFGRQFQLNEERLETQIPWTPGKRELKFTYRVPIEDQYWLFNRPLDLPTEHVRIQIAGDRTDDVSCNLPQTSASSSNGVVFESSGNVLPAGHAISLQLGNLPLPWTAYARWAALGGLGLLMLGTSAFMFTRRRSSPNREQASFGKTNEREAA